MDHWQNSTKYVHWQRGYTFANMAVLRYIWCPIGRVGPKIALFPSQSACTMVHLVPHWTSGSKNCTFPQSACTFGGPLTKWCQNCTFHQSSRTMVHLVAHWQSGAKNCTFHQSACTMVHLVAHWQSGAKNCTFHQSSCTMVPTDKVVQKLHFLPVWLYYGTFGGPLTN